MFACVVTGPVFGSAFDNDNLEEENKKHPLEDYTNKYGKLPFLGFFPKEISHAIIRHLGLLDLTNLAVVDKSTHKTVTTYLNKSEKRISLALSELSELKANTPADYCKVYSQAIEDLIKDGKLTPGDVTFFEPILKLCSLSDGEKKKLTGPAKAFADNFMPTHFPCLDLRKIGILNLNQCSLSYLPPQITGVEGLTYLGLGGNNFSHLPNWVWGLKELENLILHENKVIEISPEISQLINLKSLKLERNKITKLPHELGNLKELEYLGLNYCSLEECPEWVGNLTNLEFLLLNENKITKLPKSILNLTKMEEFSVNYNRLDEESQALVDSMKADKEKYPNLKPRW